MDKSENWKNQCLQINAGLPASGLYSSQQRHIHSESNAPWRISPTPFFISADDYAWLNGLGTHLLKFYKACNLLYSQSVRGIQPDWVAEYLDRGKPASVVEYGRMRRFKSFVPSVIRPDILPTENGMVISELDSVPGGIGFTGSLAGQYTSQDIDVIGGGSGMVLGFAEMIRTVSDNQDPTLAIVVSDESDSYRQEMIWLANQLRKSGFAAHVIHPREIIFQESNDDQTGLFLESESNNAEKERVQIDVIYRFFELFDLKNIPKSELMLYSAKKRQVSMTPPLKAYLEEKLTFALFHHPSLKHFWKKELGKESIKLLENTIPETWVIDNRPLPPHATIPNLSMQNQPITDFKQLNSISQKQRQLVIKPSGFSDQAWGARGVSIGHDMPTEDWKEAIERALNSFEKSPHVLQKFHKAKQVRMPYYDFDKKEIIMMRGRPLLRPYYFVTQNDEVCLSGIQAVVCPEDKKILHGMVDAIIAPAAIWQG